MKCTDDQAAQFERAARSAKKKTVAAWLRDLGAAAIAPETFKVSQLQDPDKWAPNFGTVVDAEHWGQFEAAAKSEGISIEEWIRQACVSQLEIGHDASFEEPLTMGRRPDIIRNLLAENSEKLKRVLSIPGVRLGLGPADVRSGNAVAMAATDLPTPEQVAVMTPEQKKDYYENGCAIGKGFMRMEEFFAADTPEEPVRSWSEELAKFRKLGEFGHDAFVEATAHVKKWPSAFKTWDAGKQVAWLDEHYPLTDKEGW